MTKALKTLSLISVFGMAFVLIGGAIVTKTGSGLGCGTSWPLCNGQLFPKNIDAQLIIEYTHRMTSGIVAIVVIFLSILSWILIGHKKHVKLLSFIASFFLIVQALIGAAAVFWNQSDFILATHFGISLLSFTAVVLLMLIIFEIDQKFDAEKLRIEKKIRIEIYLLAIFTLCAVYTGALVRHAHASLSCIDWPFCSNQSPFDFASFSFYQWVHMGHRLIAALLAIWTILLAIRIIKRYKHNRIMKFGWIILISFILIQVGLGALMIYTSINLAVALLHSFVICCYFSLLCYFVILSFRSTK